MSSVVALKGSPRIRSVGVGSDGAAAPFPGPFAARYAALTFAASFARSRACLPLRFFFTSGSLTGFAFFLDGGFAAASAARLSARAFVCTIEPSRERAPAGRSSRATSASSARGKAARQGHLPAGDVTVVVTDWLAEDVAGVADGIGS